MSLQCIRLIARLIYRDLAALSELCKISPGMPNTKVPDMQLGTIEIKNDGHGAWRQNFPPKILFGRIGSVLKNRLFSGGPAPMILCQPMPTFSLMGMHGQVKGLFDCPDVETIAAGGHWKRCD